MARSIGDPGTAMTCPKASRDPLDIFLLAADGSQEAVLRNPAHDSFPLWSPDGSTLVFRSDRTGSNALWTVPIRDGRANAPASLVRSNVGSMTLFAVTRSGTFYYYSRTGGQSREVFRPVSPEGTRPLRQALAWTPDQRYLLLVRDDKSLWKVSTAGGQPEKVGIPMENIKNLAVHPDGRQLVFDAATEEPTREVWALENFLSR